jgi:hypothetical protein
MESENNAAPRAKGPPMTKVIIDINDLVDPSIFVSRI